MFISIKSKKSINYLLNYVIKASKHKDTYYIAYSCIKTLSKLTNELTNN